MTAPTGTGQTAALIDAYTTSIAAVRARLIAFLVALWAGLGTDYRQPAAATFIRQATPAVAGAAKATSQLTARYLTTLIQHQTGQVIRVDGLTAAELGRLRGTLDPQAEYHRPFSTVYKALAEGVPLTDAAERGRLRLVDLASTDVQLAKTRTAQRVLQAAPSQVVGYRRVLTGAHSCGLCVVASTQRYHTSELMPIHPACDCIIVPIIGENDPGQILNAPLLDAAHDAIRQRFGASDFGARAIDYRQVLLTHQHGELGPLLAVAGHRFTGPAELGGPDDRVAEAFRAHRSTAAG